MQTTHLHGKTIPSDPLVLDRVKPSRWILEDLLQWRDYQPGVYLRVVYSRELEILKGLLDLNLQLEDGCGKSCLPWPCADS
jgi:hypothetical protein